MKPESNPSGISAPDNPIDRLHPKTRVVTTLAILLFVTIIHNPFVLTISMTTTIVLVRSTRSPWQKLQYRLLHLEGFMIVLLMLLPFTVPGTQLFAIGPLVATVEGMFRALIVAVKVNICVLAIYALLGSLDLVRIGQAAESLGLSSKFTRLFLVTVRYISVFRGEMNRLTEALRMRSFRPGSNMHTWRTIGNLAGTMVVRSIERAERVDEAMRCRGFSGSTPGMPLDTTRGYDAVFASLSFCVLLVLLLVEFTA